MEHQEEQPGGHRTPHCWIPGAQVQDNSPLDDASTRDASTVQSALGTLQCAVCLSALQCAVCLGALQCAVCIWEHCSVRCAVCLGALQCAVVWWFSLWKPLQCRVASALQWLTGFGSNETAIGSKPHALSFTLYSLYNMYLI